MITLNVNGLHNPIKRSKTIGTDEDEKGKVACHILAGDPS